MPNKVAFNENFPEITKSQEIFKKVEEGLIPGYTQLLAKGPEQWTKGIAPIYLKKGKGARVWDVDDNEYIDINMAVGPLVLGYCYDKVDEAIKKQLEDGITFSLTHPLEVELSEKITELIPCAESVRISKTGCDAASAAVRIARAFTGREKVLSCGYHGWHDWYISVTDRNAGIPKAVQDLTFTFNYNDIESLKDSIDEDTACVIMEPTVFHEPREGFLEEVKEICHKNGSLLIFDEIWTGFRLNIGGAQTHFGVTPDLATFSKAMANGMPISIVCGRKDVMKVLEHDVFFFTTFGGEALSLAASVATIDELVEKNVPAHLDRQGAKLKDGYNKIAEDLGMDYTKAIGFNYRSMVTYDPKAGDPLLQKTLVQQEMIKRGVLWGGFHTMCYSHTDADMDYIVKAYAEVLPILKDVVDNNKLKESLLGEPLKPVFRKTTNEGSKPKVKTGV
ncbi:MAG: aminotransferase class III-fold pyridoxal phosphate-dependent enzyme [Ignavibacteriae bacterium]|nr:aminotransferase class III-fold pyridoxal phosphate-dependent enzyme [Ignavibacteriota bacterium]MCB9243825.1 aminotransferase class III-fold pyridoxal phosphate-dependent enzyme [Ignavibacteriales bacterium]